MSEELVAESLRALRRADAGVKTGAEAEVRALLAFRRQRRRQRSQKIAIWSMMAAAVAILAVSLWPWRQASDPGKNPASFATPAEASLQIPVRPGEIATQFYPLMDSPPPFQRGLLVRMTLPASTMRAVGLPVGDEHLSDPVQAEVLVGQDDLARAVRFVTSQN